jgi:rare lipoprotein A
MPELARLPDPVPRSEPRSRYGNPETYVVFGKTYRVMPSARGYRETGIASWYGTKFHGRPTSSGEPYNMYQLTAAHRSLPIPAYVRVTNLANNKSTIVRVNDRGPFHQDRIIDLSYAAAVKLGFADHGTARVAVEAVASEPPAQTFIAQSPPPPPPPPPPPVPLPVLASAVPIAQPAGAIARSDMAMDPGIFLQAGAFKSVSGAESLRRALVDLVGDVVSVQHSTTDTLFRVRIGPVPHMDEALRLQALIVNANFGLPLIVRE